MWYIYCYSKKIDELIGPIPNLWLPLPGFKMHGSIQPAEAVRTGFFNKTMNEPGSPRDQHCMRAHRPETAFLHRPICPTATRKSEVWQPQSLLLQTFLFFFYIYLYCSQLLLSSFLWFWHWDCRVWSSGPSSFFFLFCCIWLLWMYKWLWFAHPGVSSFRLRSLFSALLNTFTFDCLHVGCSVVVLIFSIVLA